MLQWFVLSVGVFLTSSLFTLLAWQYEAQQTTSKSSIVWVLENKNYQTQQISHSAQTMQENQMLLIFTSNEFELKLLFFIFVLPSVDLNVHSQFKNSSKHESSIKA